MLLETTPSTTPTKIAKEAGWLRNRRQTDPLIKEPVHLPRPRPNRHSVDANAIANAAGPGHRTSSSPLSSESFSNPALACFSPRKVNIHSPSRLQHQHQQQQNPQQYLHRHSSSASTLASPSPKQLYSPRHGELDHYFQTAADESPTATTTAASSPSIRHITTSFINTNTSLTSPVSHDNGAGAAQFAPAKEPKSPHYKRAPASRSSLGIETRSGPPPALSTQQRTTAVAQEKPWQLVSTADPPLTRRPTSDSTASASASLDSDPKTATTTYSSAGTSTCLDMPVRKEDVYQSPNARSVEGAGRAEDLFLNIAQTSSHSARRKSKFGLSGLSSRSRTAEDTPSPERGHYSTLSQDVSPLGNYETSTSVRTTAASAHPLDEAGRSRFFSPPGSTVGRSRFGRLGREVSPEPQPPLPQYVPERRDSVPEFTHTKPYKSSLVGSRKTRPATSYDVTDRNIGTDSAATAKSKNDGTESTLSTTAPSTVWDELDDLKSRIRKLELTGKLPASSAAAMSSMSGERPRTATTTVTTVSSSPKHKQKGSSPPIPPPIPSENDVTLNQVHPLLHTALAKAKPVLNLEVYQALEATATDAINLSTALTSGAPHTTSVSVVSASATPDRILRRKADSVCRSLTELCLALSENRMRSISISRSRPGSRDATSSHNRLESRLGAVECDSGTSTLTYRRSASHEPEELNFSRLHSSFNRESSSSRRTSTLNLSPSMHALKAPQEAQNQSPLTHLSASQRVSRRSSLLHSRRHDPEEEYDQLQPTASIARSMTTSDSFQGRGRFQRSSRECTPEYNNQQENSPNHHHTSSSFRVTSTSIPPAQSAIPLRRTHLSNIPAASTSSIQPGFRRYTSAQPTIRAVVDDYPVKSDMVEDESPQSRGTIRGVSHMSNLQNRPRTNSMGTRRVNIGLSTRRTFESMPGR